jgi:hypothetical protein
MMAHARSLPEAAPQSLALLLQRASARLPMGGTYAGEVTPSETWNFIQQNTSWVVDVRTQPEWQFVGVPNLHSTKARLLTISWKLYPAFTLNNQFEFSCATPAWTKKHRSFSSAAPAGAPRTPQPR